MPEHRNEPEPSKINLTNILFAIFKWKRTILGFTLAGIVIAAAVYHFYPKTYESDARLLVRYVLERSGYDPVDAVTGNLGQRWKWPNDRRCDRSGGFHFNELGFIGPGGRSVGTQSSASRHKSAIRRWQLPPQLIPAFLLLHRREVTSSGSLSQIASRQLLPWF